MSAPEILCIGSVLWDVIGRSASHMRQGSDVPGRITRLPGGVAMNIAMTLVRFGLRPVLLTNIGSDPEGNELVAACDPALEGRRFRRCRNDLEHGVCNWAVAADDPDPYCQACRLNDIIPDLGRPEAAQAWHRLERAKRRLLYSLTMLGLTIRSKAEDPVRGLGFAFLADENDGEKKHFTGHKNGIITINIVEADASLREKARQELGWEADLDLAAMCADSWKWQQNLR